eukprot:15135207-Alexandrium_andersonii.AAC.1
MRRARDPWRLHCTGADPPRGGGRTSRQSAPRRPRERPLTPQGTHPWRRRTSPWTRSRSAAARGWQS